MQDSYVNVAGTMRDDAIPDDGSMAATDPAFVATQLLDECGIDRAILIGGNITGLGGFPDPDVAAALATAHNDWLAERWLQHDPRFRGAIVVSPHDAELAAAEIRRLAGETGWVEVFIPLTNALLGERRFNPIFEAAAENELPVAIHPNGIDGTYVRGPSMAGGVPTYYLEWHTGLTQVFQANLLSLICHGAFERFPQLRIVIAEGGFAWLPDLVWRLGKDQKGLRDELPWLRRSPMEYVLDHVRFTTQPFYEPDEPAHLLAMCEIVHAEETLMMSSDYPHWDFDNPRRALARLPTAMRERILGANAVSLYGDRLN
jgi:predicted TIM-barrel fold metal-dependent hydrolase